MPADLNDYFNKKNGNSSQNNNSGGGGKSFNFEPPKLPSLGKKAGILYVIIAIIAIIIISKPYVIISSGEVGIKVTTGKFDPIPMQPGFHLFIPFIQHVIVVDTKVRSINYASQEDAGDVLQRGSGISRKASISVLDSRGLPVSVDLTVQYKLNPANAPQTIASWGLSWEDKIINPVVREVVRSVVGKDTAEELPTNRNQIATQIEDGTREKIDSNTYTTS